MKVLLYLKLKKHLPSGYGPRMEVRKRKCGAYFREDFETVSYYISYVLKDVLGPKLPFFQHGTTK